MASEKVQVFNDLNFEQEVMKSSVPVLVDFTATWCGPCKALAPIIDQIAGDLDGKVKVGKLDVDDSPITAGKFGVREPAAGCAENERGWPVGVGGEWGKIAGFDSILLSGSAVSGSGTEVKGQHILDPRTGWPAEAHLAAWAIAPSAALSDALSTGFMVMSTDEVKACCAKLPGVSALVVEKRPRLLEFLGDKVVTTADFAARQMRRDVKSGAGTG